MKIWAIIIFLNFLSFWFSHKLFVFLSKAKPASESEHPELFRIVQHLAAKMGLPMPALYVAPKALPNAFATGRSPKHAAVVVTSALLEALSEDELEGILAHELAHIKNRDTLVPVASVPAALLLMAFVPSILLLLAQFALLRSRESLADKTSAGVTGKPQALASALRKMGEMVAKQKKPSRWTRPEILSTHPALRKRIARLEAA